MNSAGAMAMASPTDMGISLFETFASAVPLAVYRLPIQEITAWGPCTPVTDHAAFAEMTSDNLLRGGFPYHSEHDSGEYHLHLAGEAEESFLRAAKIFEGAGWDVFAGNMYIQLEQFLIGSQMFKRALAVLPDIERLLKKTQRPSTSIPN